MRCDTHADAVVVGPTPATRGNVAPQIVPPSETALHEQGDPHRALPWLADVVLGGQDGVVNVLGVVLGVAAATSSARVVLVAGLATAFAESVSMAAVAFTSTATRRDLFESERAREYRHLDSVPNLEREEIRAIYAGRGFTGELLDRVVETITSNKDVWVAVMMSEEHRLVPVDSKQSLRSALVVGLSALAGCLLPLAPFAFLSLRASVIVAVVLSCAALFAAGAYKARITVGHPLKGGLELALIGTLCALAGYGIGALFSV